ncbi:MAG: nucleoside triphosphate pyrophosphohydrolase [Lentisphaerae bacterium]|nr:nucleoside triphosphate pyrophosphohydrolase [Lentisphaerota bacterium]
MAFSPAATLRRDDFPPEPLARSSVFAAVAATSALELLMSSTSPDHLDQFNRLVDIIARLRDPERGCPWDRVQTHHSLRRFLLEETAEYLDAVESGDHQAMCDELGDILLQVVLNAQIAAENGHFNMADVARSEADKMLRRHPHVFAPEETTAATSETALRRQWDDIKKREQAGRQPRSALDGVPRCLPALARAQKMLSKAGQAGFEWPDFDAALAKVDEELAEVRAAAASDDQDALAEELGDLLFTIVNLCRWQQLQAEDVLQDTIGKFRQRFTRLEKTLADQGLSSATATREELQQAWEAAKMMEEKP